MTKRFVPGYHAAMRNEVLSEAVRKVERAAAESERGPYVQLGAPVSESGLALLTAALRRPVPRALLDWLEIHDGDAGCVGLLGPGVFLLSASEIASTYLSNLNLASGDDDMVMTEGPVRPRVASPGWIPIAGVNDIEACLDYDPAPGGVPGQVIFVDLENNSVRVVYESLLALFEGAIGSGV